MVFHLELMKARLMEKYLEHRMVYYCVMKMVVKKVMYLDPMMGQH